MVLYKVLYYPHALLKKKCTPVEKFTEGLREFVKSLIETSKAFDGGGIAAPQVGVNKRIFVCDFSMNFEHEKQAGHETNNFSVFDKDGKPLPVSFPMTFINPVITTQSQPIITDWEGCLSFPDVYSCRIDRFQEVEVRAQNEFGEFFTVKTSHWYAAVNFQHEVDHLDGVTMIDRWDKNDYSDKEVLSQIKRFGDQSEERKRIKKLKLIDANQIKFDFL